MTDKGPVTHWMDELKAGDEIAAQELWQRYFVRLVGFCRMRFEGHPRRADGT